MILSLRRYLVFFILILFVILAHSNPLLTKKSNSHQNKRNTDNAPNDSEDVYARDLVSEEVNYLNVMRNYQRYQSPTEYHFNGTTLAFLTPWNKQGYDNAVEFATKFNYLSPTWLQIIKRIDPVLNDISSTEITGKHDIDREWMLKIRQQNRVQSEKRRQKRIRSQLVSDSESSKEMRSLLKVPKVVPRLLFDNWMPADLEALALENKGIKEELMKTIITQCRAYDFDGIVLDSGYAGAKMSTEAAEAAWKSFLKNIGNQLHANNLIFILVEPPFRKGRNTFESTHFVELSPFVDHFALMTYDFSSPRPGPNAPLSWMTYSALSLIPPDTRSNRQLTGKLLLGIPFYGYDTDIDFGQSSALIGSQYIELLKEKKPLKIEWDETAHEHKFSYNTKEGNRHVVYYPSLKFLETRLYLAKDLGVGISIWEIGQGLNYFFDLL